MSESLPITPVKRPKEVWIITIWLALFAGVGPLLILLLFYFGPARGSELISTGNFIFSLTLTTSVIISAVAGWLGYPWARYALVVLTIIFYGLTAYNNYEIVTSGLIAEGQHPKHWARVIRSPITMIIIVLYLTLNLRVKDFFKHYRQRPVQ